MSSSGLPPSPRAPAAALAPSPALLKVFAALVEERIGLHYTGPDMPLFADKLHARAAQAGFDSLFDYYYYLRYDTSSGPELARLLEALVVHETFFFREQTTLDAALSHVLAPLITRGERPRIWSSACSTGEEPLTLAMLLDERGVLDSCEIVASDVSPDALVRAQGGAFGGRSLRALPETARDRWFRPAREASGLKIDPRILRAVQWRQVNLLEAAEVTRLGLFDLILCRNVLIYFSDVTIGRVVGQLGGALRPEGRLAVGASESLLRFGTFLACEELGGAFFYRHAASSHARGGRT
jgi:chemotaxis protein methyltransferase CheR